MDQEASVWANEASLDLPFSDWQQGPVLMEKPPALTLPDADIWGSAESTIPELKPTATSVESAIISKNDAEENEPEEEAMPPLTPLLDAVFSSDLFPSPISPETRDTNDVLVAPCSIDSTAATYTRLVNRSNYGRLLRFPTSAVALEVFAIVERWHMKQRDSRPSWDRPFVPENVKSMRSRARESIGTTLFGWTSGAASTSSRGSTPRTATFPSVPMEQDETESMGPVKQGDGPGSPLQAATLATSEPDTLTQTAVPKTTMGEVSGSLVDDSTLSIASKSTRPTKATRPAADPWDLSIFEQQANRSPVANTAILSPIDSASMTGAARSRAASRPTVDEAAEAEVARIVALLPDVSFLVT